MRSIHRSLGNWPSSTGHLSSRSQPCRGEESIGCDLFSKKRSINITAEFRQETSTGCSPMPNSVNLLEVAQRFSTPCKEPLIHRPSPFSSTEICLSRISDISSEVSVRRSLSVRRRSNCVFDVGVSDDAVLHDVRSLLDSDCHGSERIVSRLPSAHRHHFDCEKFEHVSKQGEDRSSCSCCWEFRRGCIGSLAFQIARFRTRSLPGLASRGSLHLKPPR